MSMISIARPAAALAVASSLLFLAQGAHALTVDFGAYSVSLDDWADVSLVRNTGQGLSLTYTPSWSAGVAATADNPSASAAYALPGFSIAANPGHALTFGSADLSASGGYAYLPYSAQASGSTVRVGWTGQVAGGPQLSGAGWEQAFSGGIESGTWSLQETVDLGGLKNSLSFASAPGLSLLASSNGGIATLTAFGDGGLTVDVSFIVAEVPEPHQWALFGIGLMPLVAGTMRRRRQAQREPVETVRGHGRAG